MSLSWRDIHRTAALESIRAHRDLKIDTTRPIDPFLALQDSGVLVMRQPLDKLSGVYLPSNAMEGGQPGVLINVAHPISRQRFSAAHELWHHRRDQKIVFDKEEDTQGLLRGSAKESDRERLAEAFAAWFLMPKRLVESTLDIIGLTSRKLDARAVYTLSLELGTSYSATVRHLSGLKRITAKHRDALLKTTPHSIKQSLGHGDVTADSWKDVRLINPIGRTRSVVVTEGDVLVVELPEAPSSGYLWQPVGIPSIVALLQDEYQPLFPNAIGGSGIHRFVFSIRRFGHQHIRLELGRPWQPGQPAEIQDIDLLAEPIPQSGIADPDMLVGAAA